MLFWNFIQTHHITLGAAFGFLYTLVRLRQYALTVRELKLRISKLEKEEEEKRQLVKLATPEEVKQFGTPSAVKELHQASGVRFSARAMGLEMGPREVRERKFSGPEMTGIVLLGLAGLALLLVGRLSENVSSWVAIVGWLCFIFSSVALIGIAFARRWYHRLRGKLRSDVVPLLWRLRDLKMEEALQKARERKKTDGAK